MVQSLFGLLFYALLVTHYPAVYGKDEKLASFDRLKSLGFKSRALPADQGVHCVSYYARTWGSQVGTLQTRLEDAATGKTTLVFSKIRRITTNTSLIFFDVPEQKKPFKVVIEKAPGLDQNTDVAIFDVEVTDDHCLDDSGSCDFEANICSYSNDDYSNSKSWALVTPDEDDESAIKYPAVDSTTGSGLGGYVKVHLDNEKDTAQMTSHIIHSSVSCIRFAYSILGDGKILVGTHRGNVFSTLSNTDTSSKTSSLGWRDAQVDISLEDGTRWYKLTFTAQSGGREAWVALDDIRITHQSCYSFSKPDKPIDSAIIDESSCDFDSDCSSDWISDVKNKGYKWQLRSGKDTYGFPNFDHTHGDSTSKFQFVWVQPTSDTRRIILNGPKFDRSDANKLPNCFSFWYFMHGPTVPRLSVYFQYPGNDKGALWVREGDQGPAWHQGFVHTAYQVQDKGYIQFEVSNTATGSVAVDDVQVYDGSCPNTEEVCGFEDGNICGYDIGKWSVGTAKQLASTTGLLTDLTTSTEEGHYIHLDATVQATASLVSPMYQPTPGRCLKFYYHVKDNIENTFALDVFLRNEGGNSYLIDRLARGDNSSIWSFGEVNIFSGKYFQIVFASTNHGGVISLDDIQLSSSACPDSYGCDFEQGMCAWRPSVEHRTNLDWQITSGHLPEGNIGPIKDVTLNNQFGHFLFLQTSAPAQPGDLAVLISQEMYTGGCLTFYYSMMADGTGDLNILIKILDGVSQPTRLWSKSGSQGSRPEWRRAIVTLQVPADKLDKPFQLFIEGVVGTTPGADIAVDEIKVHDTVCSNVRDDDTLMIDCKQTSGSKSKTQVKRSQICDFIKDCPQGEDEENCGSCQFSHQNEWCNYVDVSQGEVLWKHSMEVSDLLKAAIPQRPRDSFDKRHGGFLLVDREKSPYAGSMVADLEIDHFLGPSPPACQLHFSYFNSRMMNFIPLKVLLRQSDEETVIYRVQTWSYSWSSVSVDIGSIDSRFKIAFLGYKIFGRTDEVLVAIDDIEFRNCEFPSVVASCKDSEFRCARGSCVDVTRVCDFTDDCGDGSDENGCGSQPVLLRTSFEDGFGDWTVGDNKVTTPWLIKDGRSGQDLDSHPGRDHTLGTLTGHFMYYERHMGNPARLISPILESKPGGEKCHLRLFYFIMGSNDPNGLHVYIKTTNWDSSKPVFSKFTSHGQVWTRADIEIQETGKPFQIVIEGQDGEYGSFLGVDDISVWNCNTSSDLALPDGGSVYRPPCNLYEFQCGDNTCIPIGKLCNFQEDCKDGSDENHCGSCDFESDMCGWQDESLGIYSWTQRGSFQLPQPFRDATSQVDGSGHFVQLQTHGAGVDKVDALLLSPLLKETDPGCQLSFSYFTNVAATDENLRISVQESYQAGTENYLDIPQAKTVTAEPGQWTRMTYSLGMSPGYSRVIIRYEFRKLSDSAIIAVDDIDFENCKPRVGIKSIARSTAPLECTFSENLCQFHPNYLKSNFPWTLGEGLGHRGQRTKFAEAGSWSGSQPGHTATLTSNWIYETNTDLCVKFWYQTFGTTVKVKVLQNSHGREYNPAFSHHSYDFTWRLGFANIPATDKPFFIEIQAVSGSHSEVAHLSDITVTKHSCPRDGSSCDFEIDTCGFTLDKTKGWSRMMKATKGSVLTPSQDHTTGDAYGSFMNVAERQDLGEQSVEMVSVERDQPADQDSCTVFWYHLRGPDAGRLKVKLRTSGSRADRLVWTMGGEQGDHWMQGRVNVPRDIGKYRLVFEAELTGGRMGSIAVDDIKQEKGACPSEGTCDFDIDMCGYTSHTYSENSDVETESRWLRLTSKLHISPYAPSAEHTQKHLNGGYAASDQFSYVAFDREPLAKLVSPYLDSTSKSCVSFWYHFDGSAEGSLRVLIGSVELFKINTKFKDWRYSGIIEYSSHSPYQITFQSERKGRGKGLIAVDDILVNDCEEVKTQTVRPTAKTTEAPRPSVIAHLPVPDKGDTDHYFKTNCNAYCVHFASCHHIGKTYVDCKCQKGYRGRRCDIAEPPETPALQRPDSSVHKDTREREHETVEAAKPKANQSDEKQESNGWKVALGVVVTIIVLLVLAFAAFLFMVRTNRLQVPRQLENLLPSFLAPRDVGGGDNPIYSYTSDNGEGILNPVYDPEKNSQPKFEGFQ